MRLHGCKRRNNGAAELVEGVVGLWLIIGFMIAAIVLLLNVLAASYNKEKLGFVTDMAAVYGSNLPPDTTNAPQLIEDRVKLSCRKWPSKRPA